MKNAGSVALFALVFGTAVPLAPSLHAQPGILEASEAVLLAAKRYSPKRCLFQRHVDSCRHCGRAGAEHHGTERFCTRSAERLRQQVAVVHHLHATDAFLRRVRNFVRGRGWDNAPKQHGSTVLLRQQLGQLRGGGAIDYAKWDTLVDSDDEHVRVLQQNYNRTRGTAACDAAEWHLHRKAEDGDFSSGLDDKESEVHNNPCCRPVHMPQVLPSEAAEAAANVRRHGLGSAELTADDSTVRSAVPGDNVDDGAGKDMSHAMTLGHDATGTAPVTGPETDFTDENDEACGAEKDGKRETGITDSTCARPTDTSLASNSWQKVLNPPNGLAGVLRVDAGCLLYGWKQSYYDVHLSIPLALLDDAAAGVGASALACSQILVQIQPKRIRVEVSDVTVFDCVLSDAAKRPPESVWYLERDAGEAGGALQIELSKAEAGKVWTSVFVGHAPLSETQVVQAEGDLHLEKLRCANPGLNVEAGIQGAKNSRQAPGSRESLNHVSLKEVVSKSGLPPREREAILRGLHEETLRRGPSPYLEYIEPFM